MDMKLCHRDPQLSDLQGPPGFPNPLVPKLEIHGGNPEVDTYRLPCFSVEIQIGTIGPCFFGKPWKTSTHHFFEQHFHGLRNDEEMVTRNKLAILGETHNKMDVRPFVKHKDVASIHRIIK